MDDPSGPTFLSVLLSWIPLILLIGVWLFYMFRSSRSSPPADYWGEQQRIGRETLESQRETNRLLAELVAKLDR